MKTIAHLGLDVHKETITAALVKSNSRTCELTQKLPHRISRIKKYLKELSKTYDLRICYEAGCTGFKLYRELTKVGYSCTVIAPSSLPKNNKKVKTDKIDAQNLALYFKNGLFSPVNVPDEDLEMDKDLVRFRETQVKNTTRVKLQIKSFLLRKGIEYEYETWNKSFMDFLGTLELNRKDRATLNMYLGHLNYQSKLVEELTQEISSLSMTDRYNEPVKILCGFRGIQTVTAMTIMTHIPDFRGFSNPKYLASYVGVVAGEHSSGDTRINLGITKHGNSLLRKAFVSAAQHFTRADKTGEKLRKDREKLPANIRAIIDRSDRRCRKVLYKLIHKGKHINKAKTAIARELIGFTWEAMMTHYNGELKGHEA
ncbi:MAG: IS110 family transposase [Leptospirales bacterium]